MRLAMAARTTMAVNALALLGLLLLLPCASLGEAEEAATEALFAHIREIQQISKSELENLNAKGPQDSVPSPQVGSPLDADEVVLGGDAASDLMAHIYAMQRKALDSNPGSDDDAPVEAEDVVEVEEEAEQNSVSPEERFKELEAMLKSVTDDAVNHPDELAAHNVQLSAKGANDEDVINLLHKYAQDMHQKLYPHGVENAEDDQSRETAVEHNDLHVHDHDHAHGHGHGHQHHDYGHEDAHANEHGHQHHGHGHEGLSKASDTHYHNHDHSGHSHGHGHEGAHVNVGFSRASDAHLHNHDHSGHSHGHDHKESIRKKKFILPEEIAEEEDLLQYGFEGQVFSSAEQPWLLRGPDTGIWLRAMGCSLLVSLASLICLMILPCIVSNGKPSERVVNALAAFGAGAMLGDAFLHQLPHAFGNSGHSHDAHQHDHDHSHSHSHGHDHSHSHSHGHDHSAPTTQGHAHSLQDLSIGLAVLGGILLFFIVEKIVRRYEELSVRSGHRAIGHSHHHHQKKKERVKKLEGTEKNELVGEEAAVEDKESKSLESKSSDLKKRKGSTKKDAAAAGNETSVPLQSPQQLEASGGFVIGYLNLFSDAVHNFTDGMALGSAFLLHGTVGGWSRTLFLLAHELPQEVGDFGILVKSGFSVFEALAFNFLSALVALAGTAVALFFGASSGHSSLIEGFIAGGFIYMSVGGVMPSMHDQGSSFISTLSQLVPMVLGMGVAVAISLAE